MVKKPTLKLMSEMVSSKCKLDSLPSIFQSDVNLLMGCVVTNNMVPRLNNNYKILRNAVYSLQLHWIIGWVGYASLFSLRFITLHCNKQKKSRSLLVIQSFCLKATIKSVLANQKALQTEVVNTSQSNWKHIHTPLQAFVEAFVV